MLHKIKQMIPDLGDRLAALITERKLKDSLIYRLGDFTQLTCLQIGWEQFSTIGEFIS